MHGANVRRDDLAAQKAEEERTKEKESGAEEGQRVHVVPWRKTSSLGGMPLRGGGGGEGKGGGGGGRGDRGRLGRKEGAEGLRASALLRLLGGQCEQDVAADTSGADTSSGADKSVPDSDSDSSQPFSWEQTKAPKRRDRVLPGLPDVNVDKVRAVRELMGVDVLKPIPYPTHPSETRDWYDSVDPLDPDEVDVWVSSDGHIHLPKPENLTGPPEYDVALAARAAANKQIEQQALRYASRKLSARMLAAVKVSSEDPKVRLLALRNMSRIEQELRAEDDRRYAEQCAKRRTQTRTQRLREAERNAEIKVLRREMFDSGYHWNRYMTKEEAAAVLDRRDKDPFYQDYIHKLMPRLLQNFVGPEATLQSLEVLQEIYSDKPRKGGVNPKIIYDGDPRAEFMWEEEEMKLGLHSNPQNPRKTVYPKGDWSTRIPGTHPLLPAINSKVYRKALVAANATARLLAQEELQEEKLEEQVADCALQGQMLLFF